MEISNLVSLNVCDSPLTHAQAQSHVGLITAAKSSRDLIMWNCVSSDRRGPTFKNAGADFMCRRQTPSGHVSMTTQTFPWSVSFLVPHRHTILPSGFKSKNSWSSILYKVATMSIAQRQDWHSGTGRIHRIGFNKGLTNYFLHNSNAMPQCQYSMQGCINTYTNHFLHSLWPSMSM